jgi:signal recognition particle subunit SEC65
LVYLDATVPKLDGRKVRKPFCVLHPATEAAGMVEHAGAVGLENEEDEAV